MEHAACLSTCHTTEAATVTAQRLQQQQQQQKQSMASRLHKHQCASFFFLIPPCPFNTMRVCCTWQSKCPNALILLVSVEHFVYLYSHHFSSLPLALSLLALSLKLYYFCSAVQILALTFVKRALCVPTHTVVRCENNMNALLPADWSCSTHSWHIYGKKNTGYRHEQTWTHTRVLRRVHILTSEQWRNWSV